MAQLCVAHCWMYSYLCMYKIIINVTEIIVIINTQYLINVIVQCSVYLSSVTFPSTTLLAVIRYQTD